MDGGAGDPLKDLKLWADSCSGQRVVLAIVEVTEVVQVLAIPQSVTSKTSKSSNCKTSNNDLDQIL